MRRFMIVALVAVLTVGIFATMALAEYNSGEYIGVALDEEHGHTVVAVSIWNNHIVNVEIINQVKHEYPYEAGITAYLEYPGEVLAKQAGDIDAVAGATGSYVSYNAAVEMALQQAAGTYTGNVYYGLTRDYGHGHVLVEVTMNGKKDKIEAVKIITGNPDKTMASRETLMQAKTDAYPFAAAVEAFRVFPGKVVEAQSAHVDGVAGATHSNHAYEAALIQALTTAGVLESFE